MDTTNDCTSNTLWDTTAREIAERVALWCELTTAAVEEKDLPIPKKKKTYTPIHSKRDFRGFKNRARE